MSLNQYESVPLNKPKTQQRSKWGSVCVTLALAINTLLLVGVLVAVVGVRGRVNETLTKVDQIVDAVESGKPTSSMLEFSNKLLSSATTYFFLGNWDGTVAGFVQDLLRYDFSGFASAYITFANKFGPAFSSSSDSVDQAIVTAMNAIKSVATQVQSFQNVNANAATNAALSDGLFRLDHMLDFIRSQSNVQSWKDAAGVCQLFSTQLKTITWSGSYVDGNGNTRTWNIQDTMNQVTDKMTSICNKVNSVTP